MEIANERGRIITPMVTRHNNGKKTSGFEVASLKTGDGLKKVKMGKKIAITKEQLIEFGIEIKKTNESNI